MKVLIFQDLLLQYGTLATVVDQIGAEMSVASDGKDALDRARSESVSVAILDIAMPRLSGIECCRQLKEGALGIPPKVILHSALASSGLAQRAKDIGCDLYVQAGAGEADIVTFLQSVAAGGGPASSDSADSVEARSPGEAETMYVAKPPISDSRASERVEVPGPVSFWADNSEKPGYAVNTSQAGILIAGSEELSVGTFIRIRFTKEGGDTFDLPGNVVRVAALKSPIEGFPFALGIKFAEMDESQKGDLAILIASAPPALPKLRGDMLRNLMERADEFIPGILRGAFPDLTPLVFHLKPRERDSFTSDSEGELAIRKLSTLSVQCVAYRAFLPVLKENRSALAPSSIPLLRDLLARVDAIENEMIDVVRKAVEAGHEDFRVAINESSNRLYDTKTKLIFAIDDSISPEGLGAMGEVIEGIKVQAQKMRDLRQGRADSIKYERRSLLRQQEEERKRLEEEKKKQKKKKKSQAPAIAAICVCAVLFLGSMVYRFVTTRVSKNALQLTVQIQKAYREDDGLIVVMLRSDWGKLTAKSRDEVFKKSEAFLRAEKLKQMKIVDENERNLAALLSSRQGRQIFYLQKIF